MIYLDMSQFGKPLGESTREEGINIGMYNCRIGKRI